MKGEHTMSGKKLGFGLMRLPLLDAEDAGSINYPLLEEMVDTFLARGFTYFDTAWMYCNGKSEEAAKRVLVSRYPRDSFTLTTKLPAYMLKKKRTGNGSSTNSLSGQVPVISTTTGSMT